MSLVQAARDPGQARAGRQDNLRSFTARPLRSWREIGPGTQGGEGEKDQPRRNAASATSPQVDRGPTGSRPRSPCHGAFLNTTEALVPPKPKLFDIAKSIFIGRAALGARSMGESPEGFSRLIVGGAI